VHQIKNLGNLQFEIENSMNLSDGEPILSFSLADLNKDNKPEILCVTALNELIVHDWHQSVNWRSGPNLEILPTAPLVACLNQKNHLGVMLLNSNGKPEVFPSQARTFDGISVWKNKSRNQSNNPIYDFRFKKGGIIMGMGICIFIILATIAATITALWNRRKLYPVT
jgi:hypothetical protein